MPIGIRVYAYRNLNRGAWSVRSLDDVPALHLRAGIVIARVRTLWLADAKFSVNENGRQRVLRNKCKEVHAGIEGVVVAVNGPPPPGSERWLRVTYDPYRAPTFLEAEARDRTVGTAAAAYFTEEMKVIADRPVPIARKHGSRSTAVGQVGVPQALRIGLPEKPKPVLCRALRNLLATLRAAQVVTHTGHWTARGPNSYGDHQLLERVYAGFGDDLDGLGERLVAYCGPDFVDPSTVTRESLELVDAWRSTVDPVARALRAEEAIQTTIRMVVAALGSTPPVGLDDFLRGMANRHDVSRYLLQQRLA